MPVRDLLLSAIVFGSLPLCVARPFLGVLIWWWLAFMNPHRLTWGFAHDMNFSLVVAIATLVGFPFARDRRPIPRVGVCVLLGGFWALTAVSTAFAVYPDLAWTDFVQFSKILVMCFVTISLSQDRGKLRYLLLVAALSLGFFGFKAGLWAVTTGGASGWALGPEGSFIADNNALALAMVMNVPLLFFLAKEEPRTWLRRLLYATFALSVLTVPVTYSRGGFLGLVVVILLLLGRLRGKVVAIVVGLAAGCLLLAFLPERWMDRISTIGSYEQDWSAMSRLVTWGIAWQLALESPFVGNGFRVFSPEIWERFMPGYNNWHNAHSIYFQVLAEQGFTGLALFLGLMVSTFWMLRSIRRTAKLNQSGRWLMNYSYMLEISLLGFLLTGTFYNRAYFDLVYFVISVAVILRRLAAESQAPSRAPGAKTPNELLGKVWRSNVAAIGNDPPLTPPRRS